jgi:hypothetical protein
VHQVVYPDGTLTPKHGDLLGRSFPCQQGGTGFQPVIFPSFIFSSARGSVTRSIKPRPRGIEGWILNFTRILDFFHRRLSAP